MKTERQINRKVSATASAALSIGLASCPAVSPPSPNVVEGFYVFSGKCMNVQEREEFPSSRPKTWSLVSSPGQLFVDRASSDSAAIGVKLTASLNFESLDDYRQICLHVVEGKMFTSKDAFTEDKSDIMERLPLPWTSLISRPVKPDAENEKTGNDMLESLRASTRAALMSSGAMLAARPRFFAELAVMPARNRTGLTFRLRSIYFGESLENGWFNQWTDKNLTLAFSIFRPGEAPIQTGPSAGAIDFLRLPVGTSAFISEPQSDRETNPGSWQTTWLRFDQRQLSRPFTLVAVITETRISRTSWLRSETGAAIANADIESRVLADNPESGKSFPRRTQMPVKVTTLELPPDSVLLDAVSKWSEAKSSYRSCIRAIASKRRDTERLRLDFAKKRLLALLAIDKAQPFITEAIPDISILNTRGACEL